MNAHSSRRHFLGLLAAAGAASQTLAQPQSLYPDRPVKIVIGYPAGVSHDLMARIFAPALSAELKQTVIVENRPGATGHIGGEYVSRSTPDGYTLILVASSSQVVSPHLMKLNYKPMEDLVPVALVVTTDNVLVVSKDLPVQSVPELIAYAKANPGKLSYGSYGIGGNQHLAGEMLANMAGIRMVHVPYSSNQAMADLASGRIQLMVHPYIAVEQLIKSGSLKAIGITSLSPVADLPNIRLVSETLPGYAVVGWGMLMAPAKTPQDVLQKLNSASVKALAGDQVRQTLAKQHMTTGTLSIADSNEFMNADWARWGKVVREAKVPALS